MNAANITRSTLRQWCLKRMDSGVFGTSPCAASSEKIGVSSSRRRMMYPTPTTMALSRKGIRQPQVNSCASGSAAIGRNTSGASTWPP